MNRKVVFEFLRDFGQGSVAEWSKALVLGTSHFGGVGSNPTAVKLYWNVQKSGKMNRQVVFQFFCDFAQGSVAEG